MFSETREALAEACLLEARQAEAAGAPLVIRAGALRRALAHLDTAIAALPSETRAEFFARVRSLRAEAWIELAWAARDPAPLAQARAELDSNVRVFTFTDLPRHFALDQIRRARLERVSGTIAADTSSWERARAALSFARDQSVWRNDDLVLRRIERERAALAADAARLRGR